MFQASSRSTAGHRRRRTARATLLTFAASAVAATAYPLAGAQAAINPEPEQTWEIGTIVKIDDGDTVTVDLRMAAQPAVIAPAVGQSMCADRVDANGAVPTDAQGPVLRGKGSRGPPGFSRLRPAPRTFPATFWDSSSGAIPHGPTRSAPAPDRRRETVRGRQWRSSWLCSQSAFARGSRIGNSG